jgi:hypothetical protein
MADPPAIKAVPPRPRLRRWAVPHAEGSRLCFIAGTSAPAVTGSHDSDELRHIGDREALSIALHKPQVYVDLSGWSPKYFSPQLVHYAR